MEFVKLFTRYYLDVAILRAGEAAEVLFIRGLAYSGDQESDGFIPEEALKSLATSRGKARVSALVREGLWEVVDGGWQIPGWAKHQITKAQLDANRESGRQRVARHRANEKARGNAVTNGEHRSGEVRGKREEVRTAAAAAVPPPLPPAVEILKGKLDARRLAVRWDTAGPDRLAAIVRLIEVHGDDALVKSALAQWRPDSPAQFVQAWLPKWEALIPPGTPLHVVRTTPRRCSTHDWVQLDDAGICRSCAADALEA